MHDTTGTRASTLTIHELYREIDKVFERVEGGERIIVTRNGEVIAEIIPIDPTRRLLARWEREGLVPPAPEGGWATTVSIRRDAPDLPSGTSGRTLGETLAEMREEER